MTTSMDTQAARAMQAVSVSADTEPPVGTAGSVSGGGDTRKVELAPLLGLTEQFVLHMEREIQKANRGAQPQAGPGCSKEIHQSGHASGGVRSRLGIPQPVLPEGHGYLLGEASGTTGGKAQRSPGPGSVLSG